MQNNDKIQGFFSEQLRELKATYSNKIWGKVYTATDKEKALERCLELADFPVTLEDIQEDLIRCKCDKEVFGYVCVNPETKFLFGNNLIIFLFVLLVFVKRINLLLRSFPCQSAVF